MIRPHLRDEPTLTAQVPRDTTLPGPRPRGEMAFGSKLLQVGDTSLAWLPRCSSWLIVRFVG